MSWNCLLIYLNTLQFTSAIIRIPIQKEKLGNWIFSPGFDELEKAN